MTVESVPIIAESSEANSQNGDHVTTKNTSVAPITGKRQAENGSGFEDSRRSKSRMPSRKRRAPGIQISRKGPKVPQINKSSRRMLMK